MTTHVGQPRHTGELGWLTDAVQLIEASGTGTRLDILNALGNAAAVRTSAFLIVDGEPPHRVVAVRGTDVTADTENHVLAGARGSTDAAPPGWAVVTVDDGLLIAVSDRDAAADLAPIVSAARLALRGQQIALAASHADAEVEALRSVATRILRARELDEALLAVTNETLGLLTSDIAGVMLRDGDEIVMRACAGNQLADTGQLRMRRGQGLAGRVFATGQAVKVDDYLRNDVISDDFHYLARAEKTRSALGAPLIVDGDVIGVLEVWRRRESVFTPNEIRRLVALADLAAIALDNARLHELSEASLNAVAEAHAALESQLGKVEHALGVQQELIEALVDGERLHGVVRIIGERSACEVVLFDVDLAPLASNPPDLDIDAARNAVVSVQKHRDDTLIHTSWEEIGDRAVAVRDVRAGADRIGWVCLITTAPVGEDAVELATTQASLTFALHHLEEQSAAKARTTLREEMLLHLLKGAPDERRAAIARAKYLHVDLRGPLRICVCTFGGLEDYAREAAWSAAYLDRVRRKLFTVCEEGLARAGLLRLVAINDNGVIALTRSAPGPELHETLSSIVSDLLTEMPRCHALWGVSGPHTNPHELDQAFDEAVTATQALRNDSDRHVAVYEDLGVLALLIAGPQGIPLTQFARETIGPILAHDSQHSTSLVETLRTYLAMNCNQQETAKRLFVHQKTVKYRLEAIEKLTGLRLHEHRDRMRADIAVRANDLQ